MPLSTPARMPIPDSTPRPTPMAVTHRFVPGLRFEDVLSYQTCTEAGQAAWDTLPLDPETPEDFADDGAWWCTRRCAAVLLRRPWREMRLRPHLPAWSPVRPPLQPATQLPTRPPLASGAGEVAHTLWSLLPGWDVVCHADTGRDPVAACVPALQGGGSALLLMQSEEMDSRSPRMFWAWVVGLEAQCRMAGAPQHPAAGDPALAGEPPQHVEALLTMPFGWPASWSCGYAARVHRNREGLCDVGGISGRWHRSRCRAIITLAGRSGV